MEPIVQPLRLPIHKLKKSELVKLATTYCKHGHTYLQHYTCYEPHPERTGYLDIECSNLDADFGIILTYCIKDSESKKIYEAVITKEDIAKAKAGDEDKQVVTQLIKDLGNFDRIVTYYGKRFDVPYIRTRALALGVPFPNYGALIHTDVYFVLRHKFKLSSNRLENACRVLLDKTNKTRIDAKYWRAGARGDEASLAYILDHNRKDVIDLEKLYHKVISFSRNQDTSI